MRLRKRPGIEDRVRIFEGIIAEPRPGQQWHEVFGRSAPLYVELGTGKGRFVSELAAREPAVNFIAIEAQLDVLYHAAKKVAEQRVSNVRLLHFNAANIIDIFAVGEVDRLYINFCDPWPKNRHAKRRLTHDRFLEKYRVILRPGGELFFKTDNEQLFAFSLAEFVAAGLAVRNVTYDLHAGGDNDNIMTEYEAKFSALGMRICRCEAVFP